VRAAPGVVAPPAPVPVPDSSLRPISPSHAVRFPVRTGWTSVDSCRHTCDEKRNRVQRRPNPNPG